MKRILLFFILPFFVGYSLKAQLLADFEAVIPTITTFSPNGDYATGIAENPWIDDVNPSEFAYGGACTAGTWEGFYFDTIAFDFSNSTTFTMLVNAEAAGVVRLKIEKGSQTISVDADYSEVDDWQLLSFTYEGVEPIYERATIFLDYGSDEAGNMWYFDKFIGPAGYEGNAVESIDRQNRVYPNPFLNNLTVKSTTMMQKLNIFSMTGQKVLSQNEFNSMSINLETSSLKDGVYFMQTKDINGRISTSKLIKK